MSKSPQTTFTYYIGPIPLYPYYYIGSLRICRSSSRLRAVKAAEVAGKEVLDVYELVFMVVGLEQKEGDKNTL